MHSYYGRDQIVNTGVKFGVAAWPSDIQRMLCNAPWAARFVAPAESFDCYLACVHI